MKPFQTWLTFLFVVFMTSTFGHASNATNCANTSKIDGSIRSGWVTKWTALNNPRWCESRWQEPQDKGVFIKGLNCWANENRIIGLQMRYSDGKLGRLIGTTSDHLETFTLAPDEAVKSSFLYAAGDPPYDGLGHIQFQTSSRTWDCGSDIKGLTPQEQNVGAGTLLQAWGWISDDENPPTVIGLALVWLGSEIDRIEVKDVKYDTDLIGTNKGVHKLFVASGVYTNNGTNGPDALGNGTFTFEGEQKRSTSVKFRQQSNEQFGTNLGWEISAEPFGIGVQENVGFSFQYGAEREFSSQQVEEITLRWTQQGANLPGQSTLIQASVESGNISVPYKSTVIVHMKDGSSISYEEAGKTEQVLYSSAYIDKTDIVKSTISENPTSRSNFTNQIKGQIAKNWPIQIKVPLSPSQIDEVVSKNASEPLNETETIAKNGNDASTLSNNGTNLSVNDTTTEEAPVKGDGEDDRVTGSDGRGNDGDKFQDENDEENEDGGGKDHKVFEIHNHHDHDDDDEGEDDKTTIIIINN